jgi:hypothetical protein
MYCMMKRVLRCAEANFIGEPLVVHRYSSLPLSMSTFEPAVILSLLKNLNTQRADRKAFENTWNVNVSIKGHCQLPWLLTADRWKTESTAGKSRMASHTHHQIPSSPGRQMSWSMSTTCTTRPKPTGTARTLNQSRCQRTFLSWVHVSSHCRIFTSKGGNRQHLLLSPNQPI